MKRTFCWVLIIGLVISLGMLGCAKEDEEMKIGAILPLTGDGAKYGEAAKKGIDLAVEDINLKGGIKGRKIKVVFEDSQGSPAIGVAAVKKLITVERVPVIIGDLFSSVTLAIAPIANENKVAILSPASSAPAITNAGDYIFRNCASDIFEGSIMGNFAVAKLGIKRVAVLYINNDYGVGISDVFKKTFIQKSGYVTIEEAFDQGATDFRTQLSKVNASHPQAVYIVGYRELGQLLKQAMELGIKVQFLSTVMFEDPEILKIAGYAAEGVIYSARAYDPQGKDEAIQNFVRSFKQRYGVIPDIFSGLSYDSVKILALAIEKGGFNSEGIKKALYEIKHYPAVVGDTSFDENGDVIQPALIKTVEEGKFTSYEATCSPRSE